MHEWVRHCVERYGRAEVEAWYWETWNEANIGYWQGTREEFLKLHDYAIDAVRRALPTARVGGPDMAGSDPDFLRAFLSHSLDGINYATGRKGTPLDFVAFHAKGSPTTVDGHVRMGVSHQLRDHRLGVRNGGIVPRAEGSPGHHRRVRPGGLRRLPGAAARLPQRHHLLELHGSELRSRTAISPIAAASPSKGPSRGHSSSRISLCSRAFAPSRRNGLDLPVLNVFRMFSRMTGERIAVRSTAEVPLDAILTDGVRGAPDVSAMASLEGDRLAVLVWHYHDDDVPGPEAAVTLEVAGLPSARRRARVLHYRIDDAHSNSYSAWKRMGSPAALSAPQYAELEAAGHLATLGSPAEVPISRGAARATFTLPRQAVSLLTFQWDTDDN